MRIADFIKRTHKDEQYLQRPRIFCKDGFNMSVQASSGHYCSPRSVQDFYSSMEIGYPSRRELLLLEWAENKKVLNNLGIIPVIQWLQL